ASLHHQDAEGLGQCAGCRCVEQNAQNLLRALVALQLGAQCLEIISHFVAAAGYVAGAESFSDPSNFGVVAILLAAGQLRVEVAQMRLEEAADFGDMNPGQQVGIAGRIWTPIRRMSRDLQMYRADPLNQTLCIDMAAEGGAGDELPGAAQATQQVLTKVRMIPDTGQGQRVQCLQQQCRDATYEH